MGGKKKDKKKVEKMTWAELTGPAPDIVKVPVDWNTMLSDDDDEPAFVSIDRSSLPKAPRGPQEVPIDMIPKEPPFKVYMSGIPFSAKEENIVTFFKNCKILKVDVGSEDGRNRGNAVVEFQDRASLISALAKNEDTMGNRQVRVSLDNPRDRFMNRMLDSARGSGQETTLPDDWRSQLSKRSDAPPRQFAGPAGFRFNKQDDGTSRYRGRFSDDSARSGMRNEGFGTWSGSAFRRGNDRSAGPPPLITRRPERDSSQTGANSPVPSQQGRPKVDANVLRAILTKDEQPTPRSTSIFGNAKPVDTSARLSETSLKQMEQLRIAESVPKGDLEIRRSSRPGRPSYRSSRSEDFRSNVKEMSLQPQKFPPTSSRDRQGNFGQQRTAAVGDIRRNPSGRPPPRPARSKYEVNDFANSEEGPEPTTSWNQQSSNNRRNVDQFGNPIPSFVLSTNKFESLRTEDISDEQEE